MLPVILLARPVQSILGKAGSPTSVVGVLFVNYLAVEPRRFERLTLALQTRCSTN